MKRMKRITAGLLALGMAFALTACGSNEEQTATYRKEMEESGVQMVDTMTLKAKGDKVAAISESIEVDISSFEDDMKEQLKTIYDALVEQYNSVDGATCTMDVGDDTLTLNVDVDTSGDTVDELAEQGLIQITGGSDLSLKASGESLESSGYEKVE